MEIRVLRYFLAVAREGSITKAANFLHVTQPTLSRQIKDMEVELGKKLFVRSNYNIKLTDEGMILRKRAEDILDMVDKTTTEFHTMDDIMGGDIYIGAAETNAINYFSKVAKDLQEKYPNIRYHLYSGNSENIIEKLEKGLIDFGIILERPDQSKYGYITMPSEDIWGIIVRKDCSLARKEFIELNDLFDIPLICPRQALSTDLSGWFGKYFDKMNIVADYDLLYNASIMVKEGLGCAIGLDKIIHAGKDSEFSFRRLEPLLKTEMYIIWKKYQVFSKAADTFMTRLKKDYS